jgi:sugar diacid utilization regulator
MDAEVSTPVVTLKQICKDITQHTREDAQQLIPLKEEHSPKSNLSSSGNLYAVLRYLVKTLSQSQPLDEILNQLASLVNQSLQQVDLCVILLRESPLDVFTLAACEPDLQSHTVLVQALQLSPSLLEKMTQAGLNAELPDLRETELEALNPLKNVQYKTLLSVPLVADSKCLGLLNCYSSQLCGYSEDEQLLLSTIAGQAALMLKNRQRLEEEVQTQRMLVKAFLSDLFSAQPAMEDLLRRRAYSLNFDVAKPHVLIQLECAEPLSGSHSNCEGLLKQVVQRVQHHYPASLADECASSVFCLIPLNAMITLAQIQSWFTVMVEQLREEQEVCLSVGLSNPCTALLEYRKAALEASEALQIGAALAAQGSCLAFQDLGAYRYLYQFACTDTLHDLYQEQIETLIAYDKRKKTNLLDTLEIFLESGSNAARTSTLLEVHRNTLLQRLERIQKLCSLDLEQISQRLPLLLALKVYRLRTHVV